MVKQLSMSPPARRVWLAIMYRGPAGRCADWLWAHQPKGDDGYASDTTIRSRLAVVLDGVDMRIMRRHARRGTTPCKRWTR